jgi:hypothetical protein
MDDGHRGQGHGNDDGRHAHPVRVATALSVGKSVLSGTLSHANSALAALQLGVRRGQLFVTNELGTIQDILMTRTNKD